MANKETVDAPKDAKNLPDSNGNGFVLYYYHHCFYSQKVLLALYEKNIPFTGKLIDITKGEQYKPWFLKINPKGEVPVLVDDIKYIPDSKRIIEYLEDNFSNGKYLRLIPIDQGFDVKAKVINLHNMICSIPDHLITSATLFNDEFSSTFRYPFVIPSVRGFLKASHLSRGEKLRKYAVQYPEFSKILLQKANNADQNHLLISNKSKFQEILDEIRQLLNNLEEELSGNSKDHPNWWLCTASFTMADVSLTVLLDRLFRLGLDEYFWGQGKLPFIARYFSRVQKRDSYKKTMPTLMTDISIIIRAKAPFIIGIGLLTVITVAVGGFFYLKK